MLCHIQVCTLHLYLTASVQPAMIPVRSRNDSEEGRSLKLNLHCKKSKKS